MHGYPDNQEVWEPVIQLLMKDFYIVTYDVRGAGFNNYSQAREGFSAGTAVAGFGQRYAGCIGAGLSTWLRMTGDLFSRGSL